jgi:hypothetical protein
VSGCDRARAYQLFTEALDCAAEAREQFLTRECGADLELRAEVDALLLIATRDIAATSALLPRQNVSPRSWPGKPTDISA